MQRAAPGRAPRQGRVKARQSRGFAPGFQSLLARVKQGVAALFHTVGGLPHGGPLLGRELWQKAHDLGETALAAQKIHPQAFQVFQRRSLVQPSLEFRYQAFQCCYQIHADSRCRLRGAEAFINTGGGLLAAPPVKSEKASEDIFSPAEKAGFLCGKWTPFAHDRHKRCNLTPPPEKQAQCRYFKAVLAKSTTLAKSSL